MAWKGRQLTGYAKNGTMSTFSYDADGLRGSKTVGGVKTIYQYVGDKLYYEKRGNNQEFYYFYDSYGNLSSIYYTFSTDDYTSSANYYVTTNIQGDVTALYNSDGALVARYEYDAWGNILSVTDANGNAITQWYHIANANPIRYRGYYYDADLGLYYLQSRYYDSETGRFINADTMDVLSVSFDGVTDKNLFSYCDNNPVVRADSSGDVWNVVIGAVVGAAVGGFSTFINGGSTSEIVLSVVCGGISGGFAATGFGGLAGQVIVGAITSCIDSGYQNIRDVFSNEKTIGDAIICTVVDTAMGATFGAMGFEGTEALETSSKMMRNTHSALKKLYKGTVHPTVKRNANNVLKQSRKYLISEIKSGLFDGVTTGAIGFGISKFTEWYTKLL